jgi:hypothetical protein
MSTLTGIRGNLSTDTGDGFYLQTTPRAGGNTSVWLPNSARESQEEWNLALRIAELNRLFGIVGRPGDNPSERTPIYDRVRDDVYGLQANRLNENREDTLRKLRFGLARTGLTGGSADVSAQGLEQREFGRALMDASNTAQSAADEVRANDERTRLNLISQMRSGLDAGNATQNALSQMASNVDAAKGATNYAAVDSYAQAMQPALARYQILSGHQQAQRQYQPQYPIARPSSGTIIQGSF